MPTSDCPKCGFPVGESARFCRRCGWQVRMRKPAEAPPQSSQALPPLAPMPPSPPLPPTPQDDPGAGYPGQRRSSGRTVRYGSGTPGTPPPAYDASAPPVQQPPPVYRPGQSVPRPPTYTPYAPAASTPVTPPPAPGVVTQALQAHLMDQKRDEAQALVKNFALWAGGLTLMPIPFADLVFLIPIQSSMVLRIARIYEVEDPPEKVLSYIAAACGVSVAGQVTTVVVAGLVPIIGKLVSAPLVYGWTYGLGEAAIYYFENRDSVDSTHIKRLFTRVSEQARKAYTKQRAASAEESLDKLRENLSPQEFEELKRRLNVQ